MSPPIVTETFSPRNLVVYDPNRYRASVLVLQVRQVTVTSTDSNIRFPNSVVDFGLCNTFLIFDM